MLPIPLGWPTGPTRRWWSAFAVGAGAFFGSVAAAALATGGETAWFGFGVAAFLGCVGIAYAPPRRAHAAARDGALVLPTSRRQLVAATAGTVLMALGSAASLGPAWGAAFLAVLVVAGGARFAQTRGGGELRLDPEGVTFAFRPYGRRVAWTEAGRLTVRRRQRIHLEAPGEGVWLAADRFADPLLVYWTLHWYATHPETRAELADGRAVERVRSQALADPPAY
ncbi:MAG TPA: hypothetical protein VF519_10840 [Mycobacteriales bacterium]|jgi:hypothetical protein